MSENTKIEPLLIEGVVDNHCHCDYSPDAEGTIDEYCEAALERNLAEICFTTHYDSNPKLEGTKTGIRINGEVKSATPDNLAVYVDDVARAGQKYYPLGLSVKTGVEFGWFEGCEEEALKLRERFGLSYMLCGIHDIDNLCFACHSTYEKAFAKYSVEEMVQKYFSSAVKAAKTGLFDNIAHLDYYVKYGTKYYGEAVNEAYKPYISEVFTALKASRRTGIEVNTAGMRHGRGEYYPSMEIINLAKKAGVTVQVLGSDAHRPEQVGFDFEMATSLIPDTLRGCLD